MLAPVVVDFEGFKSSASQYYVKELAVCSDNLNAVTLKPPFELQELKHQDRREVNWCTHNLHGIHWCLGTYEYSDLFQIANSIRLRHPNSLFYAKGTEKSAYLSKLLGVTVHNLEDLGCPRVDELDDLDKAQVCPIHCKLCAPNDQLLKHCALRKVILFSKWLEEQFLEANVCEEESGSERELIDEFNSLCSVEAQRATSEANHSDP